MGWDASPVIGCAISLGQWVNKMLVLVHNGSYSGGASDCALILVFSG